MGGVKNTPGRNLSGKRFPILDPVNAENRTGIVYPDTLFSPNLYPFAVENSKIKMYCAPFLALPRYRNSKEETLSFTA